MSTPNRPPLGQAASEQRIEAARRVLLAAPVPWDELRERRVMAGIDARLDARLETQADTRPTNGSRKTVVALLGAVLATAAVIAVALWLGPMLGSPEDDGLGSGGLAVVDAPERPLDRVRPAIPFAKPPTLALADGSLAELHDGARVDVAVQSTDVVRLDQRSGTVRYEVTKNPGRSFIVDAGGVEVRVIGTVFTVGYSAEAHVEVSVERGLVEVVAAGRVARLGPGDSLSLEIESRADDVLIIEDDAVAEDQIARAERRHRDPDPGTSSARARPPLDTLLAEADRARATGDLTGAAAALQRVINLYPKNSQAVSASFQLGNVERRRARHTAAARAFAACVRRSPRGTLAEDARAESAQAWADAGRDDKAGVAAQTYLKRYPKGTHAGRMQRIVDRSE